MTDRESELIGKGFKDMKNNYGVKRNSIATKNLQTYKIVERVHQVLDDMVKTLS